MEIPEDAWKAGGDLGGMRGEGAEDEGPKAKRHDVFSKHVVDDVIGREERRTRVDDRVK